MDGDYLNFFFENILKGDNDQVLSDESFIRYSFSILAFLLSRDEFTKVMSPKDRVQVLIRYLSYQNFDVQRYCVSMLAFLSFDGSFHFLRWFFFSFFFFEIKSIATMMNDFFKIR